MFEQGYAGEGVHLESTRPVFKRGVRLDIQTCRRLRDIMICQLSALGCDPEDLAVVFSQNLGSRQVRNRLDLFPWREDFRMELAKTLLQAQKELGAEQVHVRQ
jgi:hypothetical protein